MRFISNAAQRTLGALFPEFFPSKKHDHYKDFGYPESISFQQLHTMYTRNGIAEAAVERTIMKTWQDMPQITQSEEGDLTDRDKEIAKHLSKIRFWQKMTVADRRSLVGGYSGVILRLGDGKRFEEPVDRVPGGIEGLVDVIPAWAGQLTVSEWDKDEESDTYGEPLLWMFNESAVGGSKGQGRSVTVHPDRVVVWSLDETIFCEPFLKSGYNDLLDLEKIKGAGGEGFWKNARAGMSLEVDPAAKITDMAKAMNTKPEKVVEKMNDQVRDFQKGFDEVLLLQGMKATNLSVTLPSPKEFFIASLQSFSASVIMPMKVLVGNQNGERASTEDNSEWNKTCMSRRELTVMPTLSTILERLVRFGMLPDIDWVFRWADLTEATMSEKVERAVKMSTVNRNLAVTGELVYLPEEIREVTGHDELSEEEARFDTTLDDDGEADEPSTD